jgi:hypothetical protein
MAGKSTLRQEQELYIIHPSPPLRSSKDVNPWEDVCAVMRERKLVWCSIVTSLISKVLLTHSHTRPRPIESGS